MRTYYYYYYCYYYYYYYYYYDHYLYYCGRDGSKTDCITSRRIYKQERAEANTSASRTQVCQ